MMIQNSKFKLPCDQVSIPSYLCFNETGKIFVTCGLEGQMHIYEIKENSKIIKIGFANMYTFVYQRFNNENTICMSWGSIFAGGYLAIAGSKGSLVILRIQSYGGHVLVQKHFGFKDNIVSLDWHERNKILACGTSYGKILVISNRNSEWEIQHIVELTSNNNNVYVGWGFFMKQCIFVGCQDSLYRIMRDKENGLDRYQFRSKNNQLIKIQDSQTIKKILVRNEGLINFADILILTNKKLKIYEFSSQGGKIDQIQDIELVGNIQTMSWGQTQNQIACYQEGKMQDMGKNQGVEDNCLYRPIVFRRKINGIWMQVK